jgi:hypothetical protein
MKQELVLGIFLGIVAVIVVVANGWLKRRLVARAERKGKSAREDVSANKKTRWGVIIAIALALGVYAYFLNRPQVTDREFGPFTPLIRWLFSKPG